MVKKITSERSKLNKNKNVSRGRNNVGAGRSNVTAIVFDCGGVDLLSWHRRSPDVMRVVVNYCNHIGDH